MGGHYDKVKQLNWCALNEKNNGIYTWGAGRMVQNCMADPGGCRVCNNHDYRVFCTCGIILFCGGQYLKRTGRVDFLKRFAKGNA